MGTLFQIADRKASGDTAVECVLHISLINSQNSFIIECSRPCLCAADDRVVGPERGEAGTVLDVGDDKLGVSGTGDIGQGVDSMQ